MREGLCVGGCRPDARHEKSRIGAEFPRSYRAGGHASFRHKTVNAGACSRHGRAATFGNQIPTDSGASWRGVFGQVKSTCSCSILWAASGMLHPATLARGNRRKPAAPSPSPRHAGRTSGYGHPPNCPRRVTGHPGAIAGMFLRVRPLTRSLCSGRGRTRGMECARGSSAHAEGAGGIPVRVRARVCGAGAGTAVPSLREFGETVPRSGGCSRRPLTGRTRGMDCRPGAGAGAGSVSVPAQGRTLHVHARPRRSGRGRALLSSLRERHGSARGTGCSCSCCIAGRGQRAGARIVTNRRGVSAQLSRARDTRDARSPMPTHGAQRELLWLTSPKSPNVQTAVLGLTPIGHTR